MPSLPKPATKLKKVGERVNVLLINVLLLVLLLHLLDVLRSPEARPSLRQVIIERHFLELDFRVVSVLDVLLMVEILVEDSFGVG